MNSYIRIKIDGDKSYLVYQRGMIFEMTAIDKCTGNRYDYKGLKGAWSAIRGQIKNDRHEIKFHDDKIGNRSNGHILNLLRKKRKRHARQCFKSKSPISLHKYVGVEIEFCSSSDRDEIATDLAMLGLEKYVELKHDGSVSSGEDVDCNGDCREECECADCGEQHYCDDERECNRRHRTYGSDRWEIRENCQDCTDTETIEDCDCGGHELAEDGTKDLDKPICLGEHIICSGHCPGHSCLGYGDHEDYDCNCECTCSNNNGHEIAIVAKSKEIKEVIRKVCGVLKDHAAYVNDTCGLHVHVDARNTDEKRMFTNLIKSQRLLYSMVPRSRYRNQYCQPNEKGYKMGDYYGRYWGINPKSFEEHGTIEVRLHSGSINAEKINNWIELLSKIAYSKSIKEVNKLSDLTSKMKLTNKLVEYVVERVNKFKNDHGSYSIEIDTAQTEQLIAA